MTLELSITLLENIYNSVACTINVFTIVRYASDCGVPYNRNFLLQFAIIMAKARFVN